MRPAASAMDEMPYPPVGSAWVNRYTVALLSVSEYPPPDTATNVANLPAGGVNEPSPLRPYPICCPSGYVTTTDCTVPELSFCSTADASNTLDQPVPNAPPTRGSRLL